MQDNLKRFRLDRKSTALVIVDVQERLVPAMDHDTARDTVQTIQLLLKGARQLGLPVIATEQYPRGLGSTVSELAEIRDGAVTKVSFSCCGEPAFLETLRNCGARTVLLTGMEAHVCVFQTLIDLLDRGYKVHLVRDAICSRRRIDYQTALENARFAGAAVTTAETALFQLMGSARDAGFKAVSALIKER